MIIRCCRTGTSHAIVPKNENVKVENYPNSDISMSIEELSKQGINPITKNPDNVKETWTEAD